MRTAAHRRLKLSHSSHSGKVLPRHHTSWGVLFSLIVLMGIPLGLTTKNALQPQPRVLGDSITLKAVVPGPPPATAATITSPASGTHVTEATVITAGSCPANTIVQLYKNGIFAGSTFCDSGSYQLQVALVRGVNQLVAKAIDALNQYGPASKTTTITYDAPATADSGNAPSSDVTQLLITTETQYQGASPGTPFQFKYVIQGGVAPYAVNINWGDKNESLFTQTVADTHYAQHSYRDAGDYRIMARVSDKNGATTLIQGVVIIQGEHKVAITPASIINAATEPLTISWALYGFVFTGVVLFWVGERYELHKLKKLVQPPKSHAKPL